MQYHSSSGTILCQYTHTCLKVPKAEAPHIQFFKSVLELNHSHDMNTHVGKASFLSAVDLELAYKLQLSAFSSKEVNSFSCSCICRDGNNNELMTFEIELHLKI